MLTFAKLFSSVATTLFRGQTEQVQPSSAPEPVLEVQPGITLDEAQVLTQMLEQIGEGTKTDAELQVVDLDVVDLDVVDLDVVDLDVVEVVAVADLFGRLVKVALL